MSSPSIGNGALSTLTLSIRSSSVLSLSVFTSDPSPEEPRFVVWSLFTRGSLILFRPWMSSSSSSLSGPKPEPDPSMSSLSRSSSSRIWNLYRTFYVIPFQLELESGLKTEGERGGGRGGEEKKMGYDVLQEKQWRQEINGTFGCAH